MKPFSRNNQNKENKTKDYIRIGNKHKEDKKRRELEKAGKGE